MPVFFVFGGHFFALFDKGQLRGDRKQGERKGGVYMPEPNQGPVSQIQYDL